MANTVKEQFLAELSTRYGHLERVTHSQSLFDGGTGGQRFYVRYSKKHDRNSTFYGLRKIDLQLLEGRPSILCFLWNDQEEPLLIPFSQFEDVFQSVEPAQDGQYKVQIYDRDQISELYIANAGRFNVNSYYGWSAAEALAEPSGRAIPQLSHSQVQTLIGALGVSKGYDVWIPASDRLKMDWTIASRFECSAVLPLPMIQIPEIVQEIDVIWTIRGGPPRAFFEVEHSTPVYSALLRFNDVHVLEPRLGARYSIVSNEERRSLFVRQLNRPTFRASGLNETCTFLDYRNVYLWHKRIMP